MPHELNYIVKNLQHTKVIGTEVQSACVGMAIKCGIIIRGTKLERLDLLVTQLSRNSKLSVVARRMTGKSSNSLHGWLKHSPEGN